MVVFPPPSGLARVSIAALFVLLLAGCQGIGSLLGGGGGVMPDSQVGLPPSLRGTVKGASTMSATVDDDGRPVASGPGRQLALPKNARGEARTADAGPRRINREEIEDGAGGGPGGSNGVGPQLGANGRVGLGGRF